MKCWPGVERGSRSGGAPALALILLQGLAGAQESDGAAPDEPAPAIETRAPWITGFLRSRYRARFTGEADDHDLYETLDLTLTDPGERWSASILARAVLDLDGRDAAEDAQFFGLLDTYDQRLEPQLFHAYFDVRSRFFEVLRLGRQPLYETPLTVVLDGLRADLAPLGRTRVRLGAYGGVGEHLYESSSEGDTVFGAFGATPLWSGAELRVDWMRLEDQRLGIEHENDLFGLTLGQDLRGERSATRLETRFTSLEGDGRDLRITGNHTDAAHEVTLQVSVYRLLKTQRQLAAPLDPFSDSLFELFPYTQVGLSTSKDWEHFGLLTGADLRRVSDTSDEGTFNRDFERYYATGTLPDALPVVVSLTGEVWRADGTDFDTWGASLERAFDGGWDAVLGSYYSLYKYDLVSGEERDHVRTAYLDLRWKHTASRRWGLRYEFERNDFDDFHQLRLDYTWSF